MTQMAIEIASIPEVVSKQIGMALDAYLEMGRSFRRINPACVITCARGSSDHAALYFKYLAEIRLGIPVCSMGPSVASVYDAPLSTEGIPVIAISQSGGSHDLSAFVQHAASHGSPTVALVNAEGSPLEKAAGLMLPLCAGPERAVAATKTFVSSLVALAGIVVGWAGDEALENGLRALPERLARSLECDWDAALSPISQIDGLFVVSRGPTLAIVEEAALKFKETCRLHAEAYSAAEIRHGPIELAGRDFTALTFETLDAGNQSILDAAEAMRVAGAHVFSAGGTGPYGLPTVDADHPLLDPICKIVSFYRFVEKLSVATGHNPDAPQRLSKVTVTV